MYVPKTVVVAIVVDGFLRKILVFRPPYAVMAGISPGLISHRLESIALPPFQLHLMPILEVTKSYQLRAL